MSKNKLECCLRLPNSVEIVKCKSCNKKYHYACVSTTKTVYKDLTEEYKNNWLCPVCSRPRTDNTNTPIRNAAGYTNDNKTEVESEEYINVGARRKRVRSPGDSPRSESLREVRSIIRQELTTVLDNFKTNILEQIDFKIKEVLDNMSSINTSIGFLEEKFEDVKQEMQNKIKIINNLEEENRILHTSVKDLESRLSILEQQSRACNVEIQCVPEFKNENILTTVKQIAATVNCNINDQDIQFCTRIMKMNKESTRPRSILAKFTTPRLRDTFLAATLSFNKKATSNKDKLNTSHLGISGEKKPVYVCEHLSPVIKALHAEARIKCKKIGYRYVWVKNGRIFVRKSDNSEYIFVKNIDVLKNLH